MNGDFYKILGQKIRQLRTQANWSQSELAQKLRLTRSSVANIEAGRQKILAHLVVDLANAFKIPPQEILWTGGLENQLDSMHPKARRVLQSIIERS